MSNPVTLVESADCRRLASEQGRIAGTIPVSRLPRVADEMARQANEQDRAKVDLGFREDDQRRIRVVGRVQAALELRCQRCLQIYEQPMDLPIDGVVVADDDGAANVPRADEPILAPGEMLDVYGLVADELLLALPLVGRCQRPACRARYADEPQPTGGGERQDNPFAALSRLKRDD